MTTHLRRLFSTVVWISVLYLIGVTVIGYHVLDYWQGSEEMARQSRHINARIQHLGMLASETAIAPRSQMQWQQDMETIQWRLAQLDAPRMQVELARIHRMLESADEAFHLIAQAESPTGKQVYQYALSTAVQDLSQSMRHVHEQVIVGSRKSAMRQTFQMLTASALALMLLTLASDFLLHRKILSPLRRVGESIRSYGTGQTARRAPITRTMEIDLLGESFNRAADTVDRQSAQLKEELAVRTSHEAQISEALTEKDILLREIHHRVKNNMQVIISLLSIYSRKTDNGEVGRVFQDCRDRIDAMSLIHETLYESSNLSQIDFEQYINKLCRNLSRAYDAFGHGVQVEVKPFEFSIDTDRCIAVGMILAELISNAFKHAFPDGRGGRILVTLTTTAAAEIELTVADNGCGLPEGINLQDSPSLGWRLINSVMQRDLRGHIQIEAKQGTRVIMRFPIQTQKR
jgi:two-component sensor histidine kinase/HAMP domain-containing protein